MRSILCFGDSNTYGIDCIHGTRYPRSSRWSGILQDLLGEQYDVIEEGLGGRNTIWSDPLAVGRTGIDMLPWLLESHKPLDLVILSLGTNDCRTHLGLSPEVIGEGMRTLIRVASDPQHYLPDPVPQILVVAPAPLGPDMDQCPFPFFDQTSRETSLRLSEIYRQVAAQEHCGFLDAAVTAHAGRDQVHLDAGSHQRLAGEIAEWVRKRIEAE